MLGCIGSDLKFEIIGCLLKIENIVGVKEVIGDLSWLLFIKELVGKDFIFLSGDDVIGLVLMKLGG